MPGEQVAEGVHRFETRVVNWYLVEDDGRVAAIDAGLPPSWDELVAGLRELGHGIDALAAVVLTHAHIDHTGFAERAREEAGAVVHLHADEADLAAHQLKAAKSERSPFLYLGQGATRRLMLEMVRTGAFRSRPVREFETFVDGEVLASVPGRPTVIATPGHTFGHSAIHLPDRGVLFTGDALVMVDPYTGRPGPRLVARAATADAGQALRSLERIGAVDAEVLLSGHGEPWRGGAADAAARAQAAGIA